MEKNYEVEDELEIDLKELIMILIKRITYKLTRDK